MNKLTLGSLFDGSGGFPLGGLISGITPVWASEIEPFPIRVTTKRLPFMKHYGDISAINGGEIEPVNMITFGSPCQDMSVAGKRDGLNGNRSSLFYEAIRIVKEMRCATDGKYPRYIVWENVPGAFSSNKGKDFKAVLEAIISIKEQDAEVPMPEKGKWAYADCLMGDGWSIAYRVLDAQYWGVPQRRRRIYLVADFAGRSACKILFKSEGLSGYSPQSFRSWQKTAGYAANSTHASGFYEYNANLTSKVSSTIGINCGMSTGRNGVVLNDQGGERIDITDGVTATLRAEAHHPPCVLESAGFCTEHSAKSRNVGYKEEASPALRAGVVPAAVYENHSQDTRYTGPVNTAPTVATNYGMGSNNQPFVVSKDTPKTLKIRSGCEGGGKGPLIQENKSATLSCNNDQTLFEPCCWNGEQVAPTLTANNAGGNQRMPDKDNFNCVMEAYGICSDGNNSMKSDNPHSGIYKAETSRTIDTAGGNPGCNQGGIAVVESYAIQGSMIGRKNKNGPNGYGINEDISFTLNTVDHHAVCCGIVRDAFNQGQNAENRLPINKELQPTLIAKSPKSPGAIQNGYTVRRLTPTECARLQGFPDWWCTGLETAEPTMNDIRYWLDIFETHRKVVSPNKKPKSLKQITKWLQKPHSDSAEYKMWGNGIALPCAVFVLSGIAWSYQTENK